MDRGGPGALGSCTDGFAPNTYVAMTSSPWYSDPSGSALRVDDVNGDGLDDLVQVEFNAIEVWLNVDGTSWTHEHIIQNVQPASGPHWADKVRLVDIERVGDEGRSLGEGATTGSWTCRVGSGPGC